MLRNRWLKVFVFLLCFVTAAAQDRTPGNPATAQQGSLAKQQTSIQTQLRAVWRTQPSDDDRTRRGANPHVEPKSPL